MCLQSGQTSSLWISLLSIFFRLNHLGEFQLKHFSTGSFSTYFSSLLPAKFWSREDVRWQKHVPFMLMAFPVGIQQCGGRWQKLQGGGVGWCGDRGTRACEGIAVGDGGNGGAKFWKQKGVYYSAKASVQKASLIKVVWTTLSIFSPNF